MKNFVTKIHRRYYIGLAWTILAGISIAGEVLAQTQHSATWTDGVACIVYSHCTPCHNNQGIGPFPLTTYNEVYANRYSIAASVQARSMPPFPADQ
nr:hypothetical protein [Sphingomonadales bacterium]